MPCRSYCAQLSSEIGNLTSLEELSFNNNNVVDVPNSIGSLTKCVSIDKKCRLTYLCRLKSLQLENNKVVTLPQETVNLVHLTKLALGDNPLEDPPLRVVEQGTAAVIRYIQDNNFLVVEHEGAAPRRANREEVRVQKRQLAITVISADVSQARSSSRTAAGILGGGRSIA